MAQLRDELLLRARERLTCGIVASLSSDAVHAILGRLHRIRYLGYRRVILGGCGAQRQRLLHLVTEAVVFKILPPKSKNRTSQRFSAVSAAHSLHSGLCYVLFLYPELTLWATELPSLRDSKFPAPAGRRKFPHSKSVGAVFSVPSPVFWYCFTICPLALYSECVYEDTSLCRQKDREDRGCFRFAGRYKQRLQNRD